MRAGSETPLRRGFSFLGLKEAGAGLALLLGLAAVYLLYRQGFAAGFQFDDGVNLANLGQVTDRESALAFVFSGVAGPLGRPLSLASFLINATAWPDDAAAFHYTNTCLHLINALLVAWLALRLARHLRLGVEAPWCAAVVGVLWAAQPLLVSASLMPVQRMTTLAATFTLAGLLAFVAGRTRVEARPRSAAALMTAGIVLGGLLGSLSKENAALLPLFALVLEATLFSGSGTPRWFRLWRLGMLVAPSLALLAYMLFALPQFVAGYEHRAFTLEQRLLTEARIVWDYLRLILAPVRADVGPFHDDYLISRSLTEPATTLPALAGWIAVAGAALVLRRRFPLLAFIALWFVAGHLLESTVVPLELYFEHRNYLPAFAPVFAIAVLPWRIPARYFKPSVAALGCYVLLHLVVLHGATEVWGNLPLATRLWYERHPGSERAAQFLAREHAARGDYVTADRIIGELGRRHPERPAFALQHLQTACALQDPAAVEARLPAARLTSRNASETGNVAVETLHKLAVMAIERSCAPMTREDVIRLAAALLANPRSAPTRAHRHRIHNVQAMLYFDERDLDGTVKHLELAFEAQPTLDTLLSIGAILASAGLYDEAAVKLKEGRAFAPRTRWRDRNWDREIDELLARIESDRSRASSGAR